MTNTNENIENEVNKADVEKLEFENNESGDTIHEFLVTEEKAGTRSDVYLAAKLGVTRSNMQKLLDEGIALRKGKIVKANYKVRVNDEIVVTIKEEKEMEILAENIPLDIIYEDDDVIVINKARGMVVHPAPGHTTGTLVNALLYHCKTLSTVNGDTRPGIVHRLDKDTSGIMIAAKNDKAHYSLTDQIQSKEAKRTYIAVVRGNLKTDEGRIETQIARAKANRQRMEVVKDGGRNAITTYKVLERYGKYTVVECKLLTGRTHQIRVHMEYIQHPLVGDPKYSPMKIPFAIKGQALHSLELTFTHPTTGEVMNFRAEMPEDMQKILRRLKNLQFN